MEELRWEAEALSMLSAGAKPEVLGSSLDWPSCCLHRRSAQSCAQIIGSTHDLLIL